MKYFETIKKIDEAFYDYDQSLEIIESDYPEDSLTTTKYNERKQRLEKIGKNFERSVKTLFSLLDNEIKSLRKQQPHFNDNLNLQKRTKFPAYFISGRINISHSKLSEKHIPRVLEFPLNMAQYSFNTKSLILIYQYILRVLQISPLNKLDLVLIDSKTIGKSFNFLRPILTNNFIYNQKILTVTDEIDEGIKQISFYIENILQKQLSGYKDWKNYNEDENNALLPLKVLVINGYPNQFSSEALFHLDRIIEFGSIAGINTFIIMDKIDEQNKVLKAYEEKIIQKAQKIEIFKDKVYNFKALNSKVVYETIPSQQDMKCFLDEINKAYLKTSIIKDEIDVFWNDNNFWLENAKDGVKVPIGWDSNEEVVNFEFGFDYSEHHTLIGGRSGSGKSNLVNIIIQNLAYMYSPNEIELFLLDYKEGVEFNSYTNPMLNHASLIAINSNVSYGVTFLEFIIELKNERSELFKNIGVKDYREYRENAEEPLSRIVIIIDEFQTLFTTKDKDKIEKIFAEILRKGRSFGIHLILSTQTLSGVDITSLSQLKSQIGNRIALTMGDDESRAFLNSDNDVASKLNGKPEGIYNDRGGNKSGNKKVFIPFASRDNLEFLLKKVSSQPIVNKQKIYDGEKLPILPKENYFQNTEMNLNFGKKQDFLESDLIIDFKKEFGNHLLISVKNKKQKQNFIDLINLNLKNKNIYYLHSDSEIDYTKKTYSSDVFMKNIDANSFIIIDSLDLLDELHPKINNYSFGNDTEESIADKFKDLVENGHKKDIHFIIFVDNYKRLKQKVGDFFTLFDYRIGFNLNEDVATSLLSSSMSDIIKNIPNNQAVFSNFVDSSLTFFKPYRGKND
jgi:hypothetical protein